MIIYLIIVIFIDCLETNINRLITMHVYNTTSNIHNVPLFICIHMADTGSEIIHGPLNNLAGRHVTRKFTQELKMSA